MNYEAIVINSYHTHDLRQQLCYLRRSQLKISKVRRETQREREKGKKEEGY